MEGKVINIVIVLNYNDFYNTKKYVTHISNYTIIDKIVIVDNKSTDDSFEKLNLLSASIDKTEVISSGINNGYASGNNFALKYVENRYPVKKIVISNPDIEISEKNFIKILESIDDEEFVAASGIVYNKDGTIADKFAWKFPMFMYLLLKKVYPLNMLLTKLQYTTQYNLKELNINNEVDVISGCFFAISAKAFKEVGYFDEETFLYYEEDILFFKLKNNNYKSRIILDASLVHYGGTSTKKSITNYLKMRNIHGFSERLYIKKYLKKNFFQLFLYDCFFFISKNIKYMTMIFPKWFKCLIRKED